METRDVPEIVPKREATPKSMSRRPIKNDIFATTFRSNLVCILCNYTLPMVGMQLGLIPQKRFFILLPMERACVRMQL
jgi:hypothetical protein